MRYTQRPSSRRQESMWVWVPLLLLLCWAHRAFSRCSYPCVEQGLGWRAFLSFPAPPSAFSSPCPLVTQKGSLCCFPRGNSSLRSMFVAWSASILGSLCLSGPRGRFVSMLRCASVICPRLPLLPRVSRPLLETMENTEPTRGACPPPVWKVFLQATDLCCILSHRSSYPHPKIEGFCFCVFLRINF